MKKNDILLVYPKSSKDSPAKQTPLSILFPGAYFKEKGMRVEYYDDRFEPWDTLTNHIKNSKEILILKIIFQKYLKRAVPLKKLFFRKICLHCQRSLI